MKISTLTIFILILIFGCNASSEVEIHWDEPFKNGIDENWKILNGDAPFKFIDQTVVAYAKVNTKNTFLASKKEYADFILELDVKVDTRINSGIQIRSHSKSDYRDGVVHGYQVEIDPSDRAWSGGIYEEQKRGWINNLEDNPKGSAAFKNGDWNRYRIQAIQDTIRVWVNGVNTSNTVDDEETSGFIALQMHTIGDSSLTDATVQWKNIKIAEEGLDKIKSAVSSNIPYKRYQKK